MYILMLLRSSIRRVRAFWIWPSCIARKRSSIF
uniref:Uncharacterized protein n=1 Tax=Populus trichocarpa TaxID=3694 RepID=A0A3N7HD06_POPTR